MRAGIGRRSLTCDCSQVALGTVTNVEEAVKWLSYTYLYVRMRKNPLVYGIKPEEVQVSTRQGQTRDLACVYTISR